METMNNKWLPHLSPEIISEMKGSYLDAYVVALEGWRRGLKLKWHHKNSPDFANMKTWFIDEPGQIFSLHSEERSHCFFRTRGDKVTNEAVELGMNKQKTKTKLSQAGVKVPQGKLFRKNMEIDEVFKYIDKIGYPVVLKPVDGSFGRGVFVDLHSKDEVLHAFTFIQAELNEDIIVEQYINGHDYRLYVVGNEVVGAILRVPPNIVGDGKSTVEELIKIKNKERMKNPRLMDCQININDDFLAYLMKSGFQLNSIPKKKEKVYFSDKANISLGGDPIDVLEELTESAKETAINALKSIPGLTHGAVDVMIGKVNAQVNDAYVIELNPTAQLGGILFPMQGKARDVPKAIIDYYFPETTRNLQTNHIYFDYEKSLQALLNNVAIHTTVSTIDPTDLMTNKFMINEKINLNQYRAIKRYALNNNLDGHVKIKCENKTMVTVFGSKDKMNDFTSYLKSEFDIVNSEMEEVSEDLMKGFQLFDGKEVLLETIDVQEERKHLYTRELGKLNKEYKNMLTSTSWKITRPIRGITKLFKK